MHLVFPPLRISRFFSLSLSFYGIVWTASNLDVPCLASGCGPCNVMYVCVFMYVIRARGRALHATCYMLLLSLFSSLRVRLSARCAYQCEWAWCLLGGIAGLDVLFWPGPGTEHMLF